MIDVAHHYNDVIECIGEQLYTHLYPEREGDNGSNNAASLIIKTLWQLGLLKEGDTGGNLTPSLTPVHDKTKTYSTAVSSISS